MVIHAYNHSTWETEIRVLPRIPGEPALQNKTKMGGKAREEVIGIRFVIVEVQCSKYCGLGLKFEMKC